eukprot:TRINITY_DN51705_c0_g1_i1.p2 TRINITY_DN51705_c0_g1~~TRINITY_DN51705_c0_g1_i1.p2  ORF type:complete len:347 (-),score=40.83 TRINITY_DN51705_c0_g1_i1:2049-3089(-)
MRANRLNVRKYATGARKVMSRPAQRSEPLSDTQSTATDGEVRTRLVEIKGEKNEAREAYLAALSRLTFMEEAHQKANMRLEAAKRLHDAFDKKQQATAVLQSQVAIAESERKREEDRKRQHTKDEKERKAKARERVELFYLQKKADVASFKGKLAGIRVQDAQYRQQEQRDRQSICNEASQGHKARKEQAIKQQEEKVKNNIEDLKKRRLQEKELLVESHNTEMQRKAAMAEHIRQHHVALKNANDTKLSTNKGLANQVVSQRIRDEENEIRFFMSELKKLQAHERRTASKLEGSHNTLRQLEANVLQNVDKESRRKYTGSPTLSSGSRAGTPFQELRSVTSSHGL